MASSSWMLIAICCMKCDDFGEGFGSACSEYKLGDICIILHGICMCNEFREGLGLAVCEFWLGNDHVMLDETKGIFKHNNNALIFFKSFL